MARTPKTRTFYMALGDTRPKLTGYPSADPTDVFESVTWLVRNVTTGDMVTLAGTPEIISQPGDDDDNPGGVIAYQWHADDITEAGEYAARARITFDDARVETYPNHGGGLVVLVEDVT